MEMVIGENVEEEKTKKKIEEREYLETGARFMSELTCRFRLLF